MNRPVAINQLEEALDYRFSSDELLTAALTHKSFCNEQPPGTAGEDNERLEFLGDAVLDLYVGQQLYFRAPRLHEGDMTRIRAEIVSEAGLARVAREIGLGDYLFLGRGERQTGGAAKESLLANALEAILGAVFCDGGWPAAAQVAERLFGRYCADRAADADTFTDSKSRLQEWLQAHDRPPPEYRLVETTGPDHDRSYGIEVLVDGRRTGFGCGRSKKSAQQAAAAEALARLVDS